MDALVIKNGKDQNGNKIKTSAVSMWYFGFDFIDTIILITRKTFAFIAGSKKSNIQPWDNDGRIALVSYLFFKLIIFFSFFSFLKVTMLKPVQDHPEAKELNIELIEKDPSSNSD